MLYPEISNIKKSNRILKILMLVSVAISVILLIINAFIKPDLHWSLLFIVGIIYIWITTIYSIKKNVNIASHVMLQMLCVSILIILIDMIIGYKGWSLIIGIPIIAIIANLTMLILTIISRKKYVKYVIYQAIIFLFTLGLLVLILVGVIKINTLYIIAFGISIMSMIMSFSLCGKQIIDELNKRLHV